MDNKLLTSFKEAKGVEKIKFARQIKALSPMEKIKLMRNQKTKPKKKSALNLDDIGDYVKGAKKDRYNNIKSNIRASVIKRTTPKKITVFDLRQAGLKDNEIMTALMIRKGLADARGMDRRVGNWARALARYEKLIDKSLKIEGIQSYRKLFYNRDGDETFDTTDKRETTTIGEVEKLVGMDKIDDEMMFALCNGKNNHGTLLATFEYAYEEYKQAMSKEATETKQTTTKTKVVVDKESFLTTYERRNGDYGIDSNYVKGKTIDNRYTADKKFATEEKAQDYIDNLTSEEINDMITGTEILAHIVLMGNGTTYYTYRKKGNRRSFNLQDAEVIMSNTEYKKDGGWLEAVRIARETILSKVDKANNFRDKEPQKRTGTDYRRGRDIDGEELKETIGFKSIQYGNWLSDKDRISRLNQTFDAFKDMEQITGVEDFSLGGDLSMAFGSRGRKGAVAHYEPFSNIINLTKKNGAGSLAHEWWHAFDTHIGGGKPYTESTRYVDYQLSNRKVKIEIVRLMGEIESAEFYQHSKRADRLKGKKYFGTMVELTARAYEGYLIKTLGDKNIANDFLATINQSSGVYPTDKDLQKLSPIFDEIFKQHKQGDKK